MTDLTVGLPGWEQDLTKHLRVGLPDWVLGQRDTTTSDYVVEILFSKVRLTATWGNIGSFGAIKEVGAVRG